MEAATDAWCARAARELRVKAAAMVCVCDHHAGEHTRRSLGCEVLACPCTRFELPPKEAPP